jgi:hypothetical protein
MHRRARHLEESALFNRCRRSVAREKKCWAAILGFLLAFYERYYSNLGGCSLEHAASSSSNECIVDSPIVCVAPISPVTNGGSVFAPCALLIKTDLKRTFELD